MRIWQRKMDLVAAVFWMLLGAFRIALFLRQPSLLEAGQAAFTLIMVALFVTRRAPKTKGSWFTMWLATVAAFLPALALRPVGSGLPVVGTIVQEIGLVLMVMALLALNRSFGIAPANRGLVTQGFYRIVRHPLYAAEFIAQLGWCIGFASISNWAIFSIFVGMQLLRIMAEEHLLSGETQYLAYCQRVPWRLIPGLW